MCMVREKSRGENGGWIETEKKKQKKKEEGKRESEPKSAKTKGRKREERGGVVFITISLTTGKGALMKMFI